MSHALVTGGAGFIGANLAARLLADGREVVIYDDLSRAHSAANVAWLRERHGPDSFRLEVADVADRDRLTDVVDGAAEVFHLAGQVAVTHSVDDPMLDFRSNMVGTMHLLEAVRTAASDPIVVFASTNKVYGELGHEPELQPTRYVLPDLPGGVPEEQPLQFSTPYGCSKGAADQYVLDYAKTFGVRSVVFRQSCIYGPRQFGGEEQGWVAWLLLAGLRGDPITIYGDGRQVRDVLHVDDLLDAYLLAVDNIDVAAGHAFNIGGGPDHTLSVWTEFGPKIEQLVGHPVPVTFGDWRPSDQRVYVSDITKASALLGWRPRVGVDEGITRLHDWLLSESELVSRSE